VLNEKLRVSASKHSYTVQVSLSVTDKAPGPSSSPLCQAAGGTPPWCLGLSVCSGWGTVMYVQEEGRPMAGGMRRGSATSEILRLGFMELHARLPVTPGQLWLVTIMCC
jgi:hypothetical protein